MAPKYPVSALLDEARRWGARTPYALPAGFRASTDLLPADWVEDPGSGMVMPQSKYDELTRERRSFQAEKKAQELAAARIAVRDLDEEQKRLGRELKTFVEQLGQTLKDNPDDLATVCDLTRTITDRATSRRSVTGSLDEWRFQIQQLTDKGSNS